jgi:hypothetical protein
MGEGVLGFRHADGEVGETLLCVHLNLLLSLQRSKIDVSRAGYGKIL